MAGPVSFASLLTPLTSDQVRANLVTLLVAQGIPADKWRAGGTYSVILTIVATLGAMFTSLFATAIGAGMLATAAGGWLSWVAYYMYGVTVGGATFASGLVTLVNSGGGIFNYAAGALIFQNLVTGKTYTNVNAVALGASSTLTGVQIQATVAGSAGNANPGDVSILQTALQNVTVTNPAAIIGSDAPTPTQVIQLCLARLGTLSPGGNAGAYLYAAQTALNAGLPVNVNRVQVSLNEATGVVTVYCASPSGAASADDVAAVDANVRAIAVPDGDTVVTISANVVTDNQAVTVFAKSTPGADPVTIKANASAALASYLSTYPVGGLTKGGSTKALWANAVDGVLEASDPAIFDVDGTADIVLAPGQVVANGVTLTVAMVNQ